MNSRFADLSQCQRCISCCSCFVKLRARQVDKLISLSLLPSCSVSKMSFELQLPREIMRTRQVDSASNVCMLSCEDLGLIEISTVVHLTINWPNFRILLLVVHVAGVIILFISGQTNCA